MSCVCAVFIYTANKRRVCEGEMGLLFYVTCTVLLITIVAGPTLKEIGYISWFNHWKACEERHALNDELLHSKLCDKGPNELAFKDKVQCDAARKENEWGITMCTMKRQFKDNDIYAALAHVLGSWYTMGFFVLALVLVVKYGIAGLVEYKKHETQTKAFQHALEMTRDREGVMALAQNTHLVPVHRPPYTGAPSSSSSSKQYYFPRQQHYGVSNAYYHHQQQGY